jgi:hypothetical protein
MDPNLFAIDWQQTGEVLTLIVVLAFLIERGLAVLFESQWYLDTLGPKHAKELISFAVSAAVCVAWKVDALSVILHGEHMTIVGEIISAGVVSGGSKASLKLFRDVMGIENQQAKDARQKHDDSFRAKLIAAPVKG